MAENKKLLEETSVFWIWIVIIEYNLQRLGIKSIYFYLFPYLVIPASYALYGMYGEHDSSDVASAVVSAVASNATAAATNSSTAAALVQIATSAFA